MSDAISVIDLKKNSFDILYSKSVDDKSIEHDEFTELSVLFNYICQIYNDEIYRF